MRGLIDLMVITCETSLLVSSVFSLNKAQYHRKRAPGNVRLNRTEKELSRSDLAIQSESESVTLVSPRAH